MKCMADSKENKHRDLGSKRVIHEFESPGKFNLSPGKVLEIGFQKMEIFFSSIKIPGAICLKVYTFSSA